MAVSRSGQHLQCRRCISHRFGCGGCCSYALLPGLCRWFCWGISSVPIKQVNLREFRMNHRWYPLLFWWGGEQRLESMRAATVVLTSSVGSSLFRLVMVHYRIVVQYVISIRSFSFPFPLPSLLPPSCWFTVYHAWMHLLPPPPHTNIHTYPSITSSFVTVCNLLNVTFF